MICVASVVREPQSCNIRQMIVGAHWSSPYICLQIPLGSTRLDTFDVTTCRAPRAVLICFNIADNAQAILNCLQPTSLSRHSFVVLLHTHILFVPSKEINKINVYSNKLVNNLHIITLYKLHNKQYKFRVAPIALVVSNASNESSSLCQVCQTVLFDKLHTAKIAYGLYIDMHVERVLSRRDKPQLRYNKLRIPLLNFFPI